MHDLQATILYTLGFEHEKVNFQFAGLDFRPTDVEGNVVRELPA